MSMLSAEPPIDDAESGEHAEWLKMARDAYRTSTDYFDASIRKRVEKCMAHFNGTHAPGSKYYSDAYKYRAKGFRPKTRAVIRQNEASAAEAFFATQDVVHIGPENEADIAQKASAEILHELLNYRLDNSIPWFQTCIGAYQETMNHGVVISHQFWEYEEKKTPYVMMDTVTGLPIIDETGMPAISEEVEIVADKPVIELRPIENVRFSPSADWQDPINTSSYLIDKLSMTVGDVKERMKQDGKGSSAWLLLDDEKLSQGMTEDWDSIRSSREGKRQDSQDQKHAITDFDTVWVHRNIVRRDGEDWIYYTLGVHHMLSEPIPLNEEYMHLGPKERPYVLGVSIIEAHKTYPAGVNELTFGLQSEANDINNQRRDNVALVLNRRYIAKRSAKIDYKSLTRNIPGSVTLTDDINNDIRSEAPPEITGSAYQEQDRVNMDFDEISGAFSNSSVGSNRSLNETVGGMTMLSGNSNEIKEYQLRTFSETWVEPVLKQLVKLEQAYETDEALLSLMGDRLQFWQKYGVDQITDQMLAGTMTVSVNVGFGATNPQQRIERLAIGLNTVMQYLPDIGQGIDGKEVVTEVFGALGYKDVERIFPQLMADEEQQDPRIAELEGQLQEMQAMLEGEQFKQQAKVQIEQMKAQAGLQKAQVDGQTDLQREQMRNEGRAMEWQLRMAMQREVETMKYQLAMLDKNLEAERNMIERGKLINQRDALIAQMRIKQEEILQKNMQDRMSQTLFNDEYGMVPGAVG